MRKSNSQRALIESLEKRVGELTEALSFYADPGTYHACSFLFDRPTGGFDEDFSEDHGDPDYDRPMPGALARSVLRGTPVSSSPHVTIDITPEAAERSARLLNDWIGGLLAASARAPHMDLTRADVRVRPEIDLPEVNAAHFLGDTDGYEDALAARERERRRLRLRYAPYLGVSR